MIYLFVFLLSTCIVVCENSSEKRPHIILILADDLGWNDVSFHGSPQIPTPNIDALAASGIVFNRHYAVSQCTPSRASLLTARYPSNTGLQHNVIVAGQPTGLPRNFTIMPQHLQNIGYSTHVVGKWHLGFWKKEYTPIYRGFDTAFGYWTGTMDLFDYTHIGNNDENSWGVDLHDGMKPIMNFRGKYAGDVFTQKAVEVIRRHKPSKPLFLYLAQIVPHTGNYYQPVQAPPEYVAKFPYIENMQRRMYAGAVKALDESVGKVFASLHERRMLSNSIIVVLSDNGAPVEEQSGAYGSNWPLRGTKFRLFEGGVRTPALIWSPLLGLKKPRVSDQLMHISDWMPTLYSAAGGNVRDLGSIDGMDMWKSLKNDHASPRTEILLNVDPIFSMSALIQNNYKLVLGDYPNDNMSLWYGPSGRDINVGSLDEWVWKNGCVVKDILQSTGKWLIEEPDLWRENTTVKCGSTSPPAGNGGCDPTAAPCLFNIVEDPCEYRNLASQQPQMVASMMNRIKELNSTSLEPLNPNLDPYYDPRCHNFAFVPWGDPEHAGKVCYLPN